MDGFDAFIGTPALIAALAVGLLIMLLLRDRDHNQGPRARMEKRLETVLHRFAETAPKTNRPIQKQHIFRRRVRGPVARVKARLHDLAVNVGGQKFLALLLAASVACGLGAAVGAVRFLGLAPLMAVGAGTLGLVVTFHLLRAELQRRWTIRFLDQLVEAVELLGRSVRTGYATPAAIRMVGREIGEPVGPIFIQISDEDDLGIDLRIALRSAATRVGVTDFSFLIVALVIQRETGGQIGDTLDNLHFVLRKRREARSKIQALTAEGRMSANVVAAIPFALTGMLLIMNPTQFDPMLESSLGQKMLLVGGGLLLTGIFVTRWMVNARP